MELDIEIDGWPGSYDWADLAWRAAEAAEQVAPELANPRLTASVLFTTEDHTAHLLVHGFLHLAGYDHEVSEADAEAMEALEIKALADMGLPDPYGDRNQQE